MLSYKYNLLPKRTPMKEHISLVDTHDDGGSVYTEQGRDPLGVAIREKKRRKKSFSQKKRTIRQEHESALPRASLVAETIQQGQKRTKRNKFSRPHQQQSVGEAGLQLVASPAKTTGYDSSREKHRQKRLFSPSPARISPINKKSHGRVSPTRTS